MLENKKLNMILSLLIAIALWAFVIGEVNPEATRTYRDVPIQFINEDVLDEHGLAIYAVSDRTLGVTVNGTRSEVNQVEVKDIVATVDLNQAAIGENQLRVDVKVPNKVEVESQSLNKVTVMVENEISKEVPIRVRYNGSFNGEEEPITIAQSMESILVNGAETNIGQVDHVEAVVDEGTVTEEEATFACRLVPVDANLSKVYNVELEVSSIEITAELAKTKTVPLEVPILGNAEEGIERSITVPETITLKGRSTDLEEIESITSEPIDVSQMNVSTTVEIKPILPEGIEVSVESETLQASVSVIKMISKSFDLTDADVEMENLGDDFTASIGTKSIKVSVLGSQEFMSAISAESLSLSVDLSGLTAGRHKVKVDVQCSTSVVELDCRPAEVVVNIKEKEDPQNEPADDHPAESPGDYSENQDENKDNTSEEENNEE